MCFFGGWGGGLINFPRNVWAVFFHKSSSDEEPLHHMCTKNCPYRKAQAKQEHAAYKHKNNLPRVVMDTIKPIFRDLAHPDLLKKCLEGYSQNPNESINSLIWKYSPKVKNHGVTVVNTAVALAVGVYNDGAKTYASVMNELGIHVGPYASACFSDIDKERVLDARKKSQQATHEAKIRRRRRKLARNEAQEEREGFPYLAGGH